MQKSGSVYLVGAGPGDVGLLTRRGAELIGRADVLIHDALIDADLVRLAPKTAEIIYAGKRANNHAIPQEELNQLLIKHAKAGKTVVRLKGGDPYVFGRGGEEVEELVAAKIPFEVVPGVSSAVAVPSYAGIPLTHRAHASSYTVITGHEDPTKEEACVDWQNIAQGSGTKIILMGVNQIRKIAQLLVTHGSAPSTPVAVVRWGTTGRQQTLEGTLETIADLVDQAEFTAPAVIIVGGVVGLRSKLNWFEKRPFFGKRIVVTRTREQASVLCNELAERGADVIEIPTIKIVPPENKEALKDALLSLHEYDWIVFTSSNAVTTFFGYFFKGYEDIREFGRTRIAAVGSSTAECVRELHLRVDVVPPQYVASKVAAAMNAFENLENLRVLLIRAEVANPELPLQLLKLGAIVDDVACYKTMPETEDDDGAAARFLEEGADWITFTSSSTAENFHQRFPLPELVLKFPKLGFASIGPETTKTLARLGVKADVEATPHTIEGLVKALERKLRK